MRLSSILSIPVHLCVKYLVMSSKQRNLFSFAARLCLGTYEERGPVSNYLAKTNRVHELNALHGVHDKIQYKKVKTFGYTTFQWPNIYIYIYIYIYKYIYIYIYTMAALNLYSLKIPAPSSWLSSRLPSVHIWRQEHSISRCPNGPWYRYKLQFTYSRHTGP